jgi:hypothetical protein
VFESSIVLKSLAMVVLLSWGDGRVPGTPRFCEDGMTDV